MSEIRPASSWDDLRLAETEVEGDPTPAVSRPAPVTLECSLSASFVDSMHRSPGIPCSTAAGQLPSFISPLDMVPSPYLVSSVSGQQSTSLTGSLLPSDARLDSENLSHYSTMAIVCYLFLLPPFNIHQSTESRTIQSWVESPSLQPKKPTTSSENIFILRVYCTYLFTYLFTYLLTYCGAGAGGRVSGVGLEKIRWGRSGSSWSGRSREQERSCDCERGLQKEGCER